jgi:hypothetical protein
MTEHVSDQRSDQRRNRQQRRIGAKWAGQLDARRKAHHQPQRHTNRRLAGHIGETALSAHGRSVWRSLTSRHAQPQPAQFWRSQRDRLARQTGKRQGDIAPTAQPGDQRRIAPRYLRHQHLWAIAGGRAFHLNQILDRKGNAVQRGKVGAGLQLTFPLPQPFQ